MFSSNRWVSSVKCHFGGWGDSIGVYVWDPGLGPNTTCPHPTPTVCILGSLRALLSGPITTFPGPTMELWGLTNQGWPEVAPGLLTPLYKTSPNLGCLQGNWVTKIPVNFLTSMQSFFGSSVIDSEMFLFSVKQNNYKKNITFYYYVPSWYFN